VWILLNETSLREVNKTESVNDGRENFCDVGKKMENYLVGKLKI
jgi:hypothetical protein